MRWKVITSSAHCNDNTFLSEAEGTLCVWRQYSDCPPKSIFWHIKAIPRLILESLDNKKPHEIESLQIRSKLLLKLDFKMSIVSCDAQRHPIQTDWISATVCGQSLWNKPTFFMLPCWKAASPVYVVTDACYHSNPCRSVGDVWTQKSNLKSLNNSMDTPIWFSCSVKKA